MPDEVLRMLNRTPGEMARDLRLYAALMLFRPGKLSSGAAAVMAGVPRVLFPGPVCGVRNSSLSNFAEIPGS